MVFAVPVGGLIATSGVIAVVIGLALQSTLSDVFSGIAIDIERPYRAGDVLSVEGGVEGRVREVNWRSTLIATGNGDVAVVPNSVMAKARLVNHSLPAPVRRASVEVRLDPRILPERCRAALDAAVLACRLPLADPPPSVAQTALRGDGAVYEIAFSVPSADVLGPARTEMLAQVQRHLLHAAIPLAVDGLAEVPALPVPTAADLLARSDLFGILAEPERDLLAERDERASPRAGRGSVRPGRRRPRRSSSSLRARSASCGANADGTEFDHRLSPGMALGAISLITEAPYAVAATALTPVKAFRLDRAAITAAITERPTLTEGLEELARRGQAAISADLAAARDHRDE